MKLYVKESTETNQDGEKLTVIRIYQSKPVSFSYIMWTED